MMRQPLLSSYRQFRPRIGLHQSDFTPAASGAGLNCRAERNRTFGQVCRPDKITVKCCYIVCGRQRRKLLTCENFTWSCYGFNPCGASDVSTGKGRLPTNRIKSDVDGSSMNRNSDTKIFRQSELRPIGRDYKVAQIKGKTSSVLHLVKCEEEAISPCIHVNGWVRSFGD